MSSSSAPGDSTSNSGSGQGKVSTTTTAVASSKNLLEQLPAGAVLAFQALAGTFTNQGHCYTSNWWLTVGLVTVLSATCIFFVFTDSLVFKGKVYYGVAIPGRLNILNMRKREEEVVFKELKPELTKLGLTTLDWVHAFMSLVVFLTIAGSDVGLQNCFFPKADVDTEQVLKNLPLGMAVMSTFLFMIFPTTRKGIRFDNSNNNQTLLAQKNKSDNNANARMVQPSAPADDQAPGAGSGAGHEKNAKPAAAERAVMSSANLMQLLPTGPVLAFQTLAASFTNQGHCYRSNWWLTVGLVVFLGAACVFSSFTDCIQERGTRKVHRGVALPRRLHIMGMSIKDQKAMFDRKELRERRLKPVDWIHAFFSAVVFLTIAGSDVGLQNCFFPDAKDDTRQLLKNLPLGFAVMSSFVFTVFPTTRNSMCFDESDNSSSSSNNTGEDEKQGNTAEDKRQDLEAPTTAKHEQHEQK